MAEAIVDEHQSSRRALLLGVSNFDDPALNQLQAPPSDVSGLASVLSDPAIGGFEVTTALEESSTTFSQRIEEFFLESRREDLLLLYFSGHGLKAEDGELYLSGTNTKPRALRSTAVSARFISEVMNTSRAARVVVILECCYSGAFTRGMTPKQGPDVDVLEHFGGRGRVILSASQALQYSFEGDSLARVKVLTLSSPCLPEPSSKALGPEMQT